MAAVGGWRRQATVGALLIMLLAGAIGVLFFLMAMAPCRVELAPGALARYQLRTEIAPLEAGAAPTRVEEQELTLLCLRDDQQVALVSPGERGTRDELTLLKLDRDGSVRRFDGAMRLLETGKAIGFFDFNLLPLPRGLDQSWRVELVYAVPPPGKRRVVGQVRRIANGVDPIFELRLPTIEWVERGGRERYCQIKDLVCRYRYDSHDQIVDQARLRFIAGVEDDDAPEGARYRRVSISLEGELARSGRGDAVALHDLAVAAVGTQTLLEDGRRRGLGPLIQRLRNSADQAPPELAQVIERLLREAELQAPPPGAERSWAVQILSVRGARRAAAENVARELVADGWPAFVALHGQRAVLRVGPYAEQDSAIMQRLRERFPRERPIWLPHDLRPAAR